MIRIAVLCATLVMVGCGPSFDGSGSGSGGDGGATSTTANTDEHAGSADAAGGSGGAASPTGGSPAAGSAGTPVSMGGAPADGGAGFSNVADPSKCHVAPLVSVDPACSSRGLDTYNGTKCPSPCGSAVYGVDPGVWCCPTS